MTDALTRRRVVLVGQVDLETSRPSGVKTYIRLLARGLAQANQSVAVWDLGPRRANAPFSSRPLGRPKKMPNLILFWSRFVSTYISRHPRNAIFHFQRPEELVPLAILSPLAPIVVTVHGPHWRTVSAKYGRLAGMIHRALVAACLFRADRVVAVSDALAGELAARFGWLQTKIATIPPIVDAQMFSPLPGVAARERMGLESDAIVVLYSGRLDGEKNLRLLVETVAELRRSLPQIELVVCGSGPERDSLVSKAKDLRVPIRIMGDLSPSELRWAYACGDLLILTSNYEGFPTVVLEALACGKPVVCTSLPGVEGLLVERGALNMVDSLEPADIALEASRVLESSVRQTLNFPSLDAYSPDSVACRFLKLYAETSGAS